MHAAVLAGVEHEDLRQVTPAEVAVDAGPVDRPDRQVLEPRLVGVCDTARLLGEDGGVVVVVDLVVVPDRDERVCGVCSLEVRVALVELVAGPVAGQIARLGRGFVADLSQQLDRRGLVDVVPEEQHGVEWSRRDVPPGGVVAAGVRLATGVREGQRADRGTSRGQGLRMAHG